VLTIRRRSRDVGVLRSLGFTPRQVGATLLTMAGTTVAVGVLVGVPLGLALGRLAWNETAAALGLAPEVRLPVAALVALVPVAAVVTTAVAALPARQAARLSPATALRAE
jgi:ABC-type antimicrobial peptide transport system permease subunit